MSTVRFHKRPPTTAVVAASCGRGFGRGRNIAATKAIALVAATMKNGARRSPDAAMKPPKAGPRTLPAEFAAEMMLLKKARLACCAVCAMYTRDATMLMPPPKPATTR
jgi:hypothetical protein